MHHSLNLIERPGVEIEIFDSTAAVGDGEAVYVAAAARPIRDDELGSVSHEAFRTTAGARIFQPEDAPQGRSTPSLVATARSYEVHVVGSHPVHGCGVDTRQPADPTRAALAS